MITRSLFKYDALKCFTIYTVNLVPNFYWFSISSYLTDCGLDDGAWTMWCATDDWRATSSRKVDVIYVKIYVVLNNKFMFMLRK